MWQALANRTNLLTHDAKFQGWLINFLENMPKMRGELDISEIPKTHDEPALIIGNGPSIQKYGHLDALAKSKFRGTVFCCDTSLKKTLATGVCPSYVVNCDSHEILASYLDNTQTNGISLIMNGVSSPKIRGAWNGRTYWYIDNIGMCDAHPYSVAEVLSFLANGKTVIKTGGHVGCVATMVAHAAGYTPIGLIGMDCSLQEPEGKCTEEMNPHWQNNYYVNDLWRVYRENFIERVRILNANVVNCSGQGSLHEPEVKCMNFAQFLKKWT